MDSGCEAPKNLLCSFVAVLLVRTVPLFQVDASGRPIALGLDGVDGVKGGGSVLLRGTDSGRIIRLLSKLVDRRCTPDGMGRPSSL